MSDYKPISIISEYNIVEAVHVKQISTNRDYREEIYNKQLLLRKNMKISTDLITPIILIDEFYTYLLKPYYAKRITDIINFENRSLNIIPFSYWLDIAISINELHKNNISHKNLTIESYFINSENHLVLNDVTPLNRFIIDKRHEIIYTSPEELRGEDNSLESDMWSIGIIIYTLIFNTPPFYTINDLFNYINEDCDINYNGLDSQFQNILQGLLIVNKERRLTSSKLLNQLKAISQISLSSKSITTTEESTKELEELNNLFYSSPLSNKSEESPKPIKIPTLPSILLKFQYELLDKIGEGPIGIVYKTKSEKYPNVPLAVKVIKSNDIDEMSLLVSMNKKMGSSCIQIIESIVELNQMFIVTKQYNLNMKDKICDNFNQLLETLQLIHHCRRPHMDIKPNNILMNDYNNKWLYSDAFILSLYENNDREMLYNCNINYIAPEVLEGRKYDVKSDCWSLGCILFEILTLVQAFSDTPIDNEANFDIIWEGYNQMYKNIVVGLLNRDHDKRLNVDEALSIMQKGRSLN